MVPVLALFLTLGGALQLAIGLHSLIAGRRSTGWPHVRGIVRRVRTPILGRRVLGWLPVSLTYQYVVDEVLYEGTNVRYGIQHAPDTRLRYPQGTEVSVSYDPRDPRRAVLEPGPGRGTRVQAALGALVLAVGLILGFI
jgi:hypothetical protein